MATEIRVPTLGESVTEATIGKWFKKPGDAVKADEPLGGMGGGDPDKFFQPEKIDTSDAGASASVGAGGAGDMFS